MIPLVEEPLSNASEMDGDKDPVLNQTQIVTPLVKPPATITMSGSNSKETIHNQKLSHITDSVLGLYFKPSSCSPATSELSTTNCYAQTVPTRKLSTDRGNLECEVALVDKENSGTIAMLNHSTTATTNIQDDDALGQKEVLKDVLDDLDPDLYRWAGSRDDESNPSSLRNITEKQNKTRVNRNNAHDALTSALQKTPSLEARSKYNYSIREQESDSLEASKPDYNEGEERSISLMASDLENSELKEWTIPHAGSEFQYSDGEGGSTTGSASRSQYNEGEVGSLGRQLGRCPLVLIDSSGEVQAVNGTIDTGSLSSFISERAVIEHELFQEPLLGSDIKSFYSLISDTAATPTTFVRVYIKGKKAGLDQFQKVHLRVLEVPVTSDVDIVIGMPMIEKFQILSKIQQFPTFDESGNPLFALRYKLYDGMRNFFR